jgi:uncharacterized protein (DUF2147 family)
MRRFDFGERRSLSIGLNMLQRPRISTRTLRYCGIAATAGLFLAGLTPAIAADPTGDWKVEDGVANIRVAECGGSMWGAVSWEKMPGGTDKNNPDASKQSRPTLAMVTLLDMKKNAANDKWAGQVYNAKDGKLYKSTIKLGDTPDQLEIEGCVLGFLCGGQTWTRVGPSIPSSPFNLTAKNAPKPPVGAKVPPAPVAAAKPASAPITTAKAGQKAGTSASANQPPDIGDICLLPEISKVTH